MPYTCKKHQNCALKDGQGSTSFGTSVSEEHWMATNKETLRSAILSKCGKTLPHKSKNKDSAGEYSVEIQKTIAIRTPLVCEDLHQLWTQECEEPAWKPHKSIYKLRWAYQEHGDTFFKSKTVTGAVSQAGRLLRRMDQTLRQNELLSTSEMWTSLIPSIFWKTHQPCSRQENFAKTNRSSLDGRKTITHVDRIWQNHHLQVGKCCTHSRTRICC